MGLARVFERFPGDAAPFQPVARVQILVDGVGIEQARARSVPESGREPLIQLCQIGLQRLQALLEFPLMGRGESAECFGNGPGLSGSDPGVQPGMGGDVGMIVFAAGTMAVGDLPCRDETLRQSAGGVHQSAG